MMFEGSNSRDQKRILWVAISLMIAVSVIVLTLTLRKLYQSNFEQQVEGLRAMVREQVVLIKFVARFDQQYVTEDFSGGAEAATLEQIVEKGASAHDQVLRLVHKALDPAPAIQ
jgi:hypothetical protein